MKKNDIQSCSARRALKLCILFFFICIRFGFEIRIKKFTRVNTKRIYQSLIIWVTYHLRCSGKVVTREALCHEFDSRLSAELLLRLKTLLLGTCYTTFTWRFESFKKLNILCGSLIFLRLGNFYHDPIYLCGRTAKKFILLGWKAKETKFPFLFILDGLCLMVALKKRILGSFLPSNNFHFIVV